MFESISDARAIIGMRNVIAHGYDGISPERIVQTVRGRLPQLHAEVLQLLDK